MAAVLPAERRDSGGMKPTFHEDFSRKEKVKGSTDRGFGLTVGGILLAIAALRTGLHLWHDTEPGWVEGGFAAIGVVLFGFGLAAPARLAPLNRAWTALGLLLFKVVNPVVLGIIYLTTIVPIGLFMRVSGRDPLHLKFDRQAGSYWVVRDPPGPVPQSMTQQF
jgi:Saxitoxin biosynthesis operon protein SxtJ